MDQRTNDTEVKTKKTKATLRAKPLSRNVYASTYKYVYLYARVYLCVCVND